MNEIWWEPVLVLHLRHLFHRHPRRRKRVEMLHFVHVHGDASVAILLGHQIGVRLYNRQSKRGDPGYIFTAASDHVRAFSQPVLNLL